MQLFKNLTQNDFFWLILVIMFTIGFFMFMATQTFEFNNFNAIHEPIYFGLSSVECLIIFCSLNVFVFFGIKEFFRKYSYPIPNLFIAVSGFMLLFALFLITFVWQ